MAPFAAGKNLRCSRTPDEPGNRGGKKTSAYFISQCKEGYEQIATAQPHSPGPATTVSQQTAAGAGEIAGRLTRILENTESKFPREFQPAQKAGKIDPRQIAVALIS
jgi:hypothetical protein